MKISFRILIINFAIVALILGSSAIAYYSIMYNVLSSQQSKYLFNSTNQFILSLNGTIQDTQDEFHLLAGTGLDKLINSNPLKTKNIDFILETPNDTTGLIIKKAGKEDVHFTKSVQTIKGFEENNPFAVVNSEVVGGKKYFYGKILSNKFLDNLSKKINANVALIWKGSTAEISDEAVNQKFFYSLNEIYNNISSKNNFYIYSLKSESADLIATIYKPSSNYFPKADFQYLIFTNLNQANDLRTSIKNLLIVIGFAGVALSLILTLLFTDKLRKQIKQLSLATKFTKEGNFQNKIKVQSKDEIGQLAGAFNSMLDELQKNENAKNEYSEFITLINRNPTLAEISEAALKKIIFTCGFTIGVLYTVEDDKLKPASSYGLSKDYELNLKPDNYDAVVKNRETIEINSGENLPVVSTGLISIQIKNLIIIPVIYNNKTVAVLELGSINKPDEESKEYLFKIKEQLAIGITNAIALTRLEDLVSELKKLNDDYQSQNIQIRKQNETLLELHAQLKEKAAELEVQKEKAEEATRLKSHFLASMSHELRTPMNSILGLTELILEDKTLHGKNRERIEVVLKSGKRLMNLINDILDLSKIEAGKMEIHEEDVHLDELLKEVENSIIPLVQQKGIRFNLNRKISTNIIINTDRGKITQVLINLLGNAVKFTESGFIELRISSLENRMLQFDVVDSGIGISDQDQKVIFEEFRQIDGTTTRKYNGTGLGLAICKKIADLLNGSLSVKSEPGKGSTFTFTIPLTFVKINKAEPNININLQALIQNRKNPVLVIDDDSEIRYTIGQYLTSKGYEVAFASSGSEGIELARQIQPFAITLDVMMPGKDGWTILKELKDDPLTKDIPVILISIIGDKNIGYGLGAFEYFIKPIEPEKLLSAFKKLESLANKKVEKIVIVDDDELEFEKFKNAFKNDKVRIEYIKDSELAFSKILEVQPDLIILDLMMPNVDGITLSYKLKSNNDTKHIPIIISTARDLTEEERSSLNNIVEEITVKSKGHPLDVLKIVRDMIRMEEVFVSNEDNNGKKANEEDPDSLEPYEEDDGKSYQGEVLVVDDDPDTLFTISEIVQACGYKTILAKNGKECIQTLEHKIPDLILLDIMMPEMDGFQTISAIKKNNRWINVPVFAVTAKAMLEDKEVIFKHGFNDYIAKPVNSGVMAFKIERLLSKIKLT